MTFEVLTGTPAQEWIRLMDEGILCISHSMDTIGKIVGQIPPDHIPTSSSQTDLVCKQEGVVPDKYHPSHRVSFIVILLLRNQVKTIIIGLHQ